MSVRLGATRKRDELAAFVLHFDGARDEQRMPRERRPAGDAKAERRVRCRLGFDARRGKRGTRLVARGLLRVDPEVERRGGEPRAGERRALGVAVRRAEPLPQPVRQVGGHGGGERRREARLELAQPRNVVRADEAVPFAQADAELAHEDRQRQAPRRASLRELRQRAPPAEPREHAVGDQRAVLLPHRLVPPEEIMQQRVGRMRQRIHLGDGGREPGDLVRPRPCWSGFALRAPVRRHCRASVSSTRIESSVASSVAPKMLL